MPIRCASARAPVDRLRRAAGALAVGGRVGPQLERDREHLVAGVERELRGGGAVHAAAHGDERAARVRARAARRRPSRPRRARGAARRRRASAAWRLGGISPPSAPATSSGVIRAAVEEGLALDQLDDGAAGGAGGAAALGVEAGLGDAVALHAHGHAHEVAAGGAAGGAGVRPVGAARRARAAPPDGPRTASWRRLTDRAGVSAPAESGARFELRPEPVREPAANVEPNITGLGVLLAVGPWPAAEDTHAC